MPWLYNPSSGPETLETADQLHRNIPGHGRYYCDPSQMTGMVRSMVDRGLLVDQGGDPSAAPVAAESAPVVHEAGSVVHEAGSVAPAAPDLGLSSIEK